MDEQDLQIALDSILFAARHPLQFLGYFKTIKRGKLGSETPEIVRLLKSPRMEVFFLAY